MTSNRFFIQKHQIQNNEAFLCGSEHHHLARVSRIKTGDKIWLFDETGNTFMASVNKIEKGRTLLHIEKKEPAGSSPLPEIELIQAILKKNKMEHLIQKATEIGVSRFKPVETRRSLKKSKDIRPEKMKRWRRISLEAVKQSGRSKIPEVCQPESLDSALKECRAEIRFFLSQSSRFPLKKLILEQNTGKIMQASSFAVVCGPEGGWTEKEEDSIVEHGFTGVSLGRYILRAETAALAAAAVISLFWEI